MSRFIGNLVLMCTIGFCGWSCAPKGIADALTGTQSSSGTSSGAWGSNVYPSELYAGENVVTVRTEAGIAELKVRVDASRPGAVQVQGDKDISGCPQERELHITLEPESNTQVGIRISGKDCLGRALKVVFLGKRTWQPDRVTFSDVEIGNASCKEFVVGLTASSGREIIDSITVPDSLPIRLGFADANQPVFPIVIPGGKELWYNVCFTGVTPGKYIFPITSWMRRDQPAGGYTNYPVADTGVITVVEEKKK